MGRKPAKCFCADELDILAWAQNLYSGCADNRLVVTGALEIKNKGFFS
jgi:hypothetical protein